MPLQAVRLDVESKKCFFFWCYSYFFLHVVSSFLLSNFLLIYKQIFSSNKTEMIFLTDREKNFCRLSLILLNVSLTRVLKYKKKIRCFFRELRSVKER